MSVNESLNRTVNLVSTAVVGIAGIAFLPEAFSETEPLFKIDDILLAVLGIGAIIWYSAGKNSSNRSIAPVLFVVTGVAIKILGIFLEFSDKTDVGDDFGGVLLFVLASALVYWLYKKVPELAGKKSLLPSSNAFKIKTAAGEN